MAFIGTNAAVAWVNFKGDGTVAIRDSYNTTSIGDEGTGLYVMNTGTLADDDICVQITADNFEGTQGDSFMVGSPRKDTIYTGGARFQCLRLWYGQATPDVQDPSNVMVSIHR